MEENKIVNSETPEKKNIKFNFKKSNDKDKIKNQALFKRGTYSVVITAIVLAGIIAFNILLGVLSDRFMLEYDMTSEKVNTISEENIEYIKGIEEEVEVIMCAKADEYSSGSMTEYAQYLYGITDDYSDYYKQTVNLINKYNGYNNKIKVDFVDTQDASFADITSKYSNEKINYGDIIVRYDNNGNERYKIIGYKDIYNVVEDDTYAAYGYSTAIVEGNDIETALTSAIAYVTSANEKKVAFITGHSSADYTETYRKLLETNGYKIDVLSDSIINEISNEYGALFIVAPTKDFLESELDAISNFLDNGEMYNKGLVFFADATAPYLPNLYSYLEQWGIEISEGILFETDANNYMPDEPTVLGSYPYAEDSITNNIQVCITGYNVAMNPAFSEDGTTRVSTLIATPETVVNAPVGTSNSWNDAENYEKTAYSTVLQSQRTSYDEDNNLIANNIIAFSSIEFIYSDYAEYPSVGNKNIALAAAERAVGAEDTGISFVTKYIENESFADSVTQTSANVINIIFMILLPIVCIVVCIYVYIRRKNS